MNIGNTLFAIRNFLDNTAIRLTWKEAYKDIDDGAGTNVTGITDAVKQVGQDGYVIAYTVSGFVAVIFLIITGILFMVHRNNPNKREENKSGLFWICVGVVVVCSAISIVTWAFSIGGGANGTT